MTRLRLVDSLARQASAPDSKAAARELLIKVMAEGMRPQQAREHLIDRGMPETWFTVKAVRMIRFRAEVPSQNVNAEKYIPWELAIEHRDLQVAQNLRAMARKEQGMPIADQRRMLMDNFMRRLQAEDLVVHYDPVNGFARVPRRYKIIPPVGLVVPVDTGWVRDPFLDDGGNPIT